MLDELNLNVVKLGKEIVAKDVQLLKAYDQFPNIVVNLGKDTFVSLEQLDTKLLKSADSKEGKDSSVKAVQLKKVESNLKALSLAKDTLVKDLQLLKADLKGLK